MSLKYHGDVPFTDEWEMYRPGGIGTALNVNWLFAFHNEHRLLMTKLIAWALLNVDHLRLKSQVVINLVMYFTLTVGIVTFCRRRLQAPLGILLGIFGCALTYEIHIWSFQTHFTVCPLAFCAALLALLRRDRGVYWAIPAVFVSVYSFSQGIVCGALVAGTSLALAWRHPKERKRYILVAAACVPILSLWFIGLPASGPKAMPWSAQYWLFAGVQLSRGFGYDSAMPAIGLVFGAAVVALCAYHVWRWSTDRSTDDAWLIAVVFTLAGMATVALIANGRAVGLFEFATSSRYMQNILLFVPVSWALAYPLMRNHPSLVMASLLLIIVPYGNEYNFRATYGSFHRAVSPRDRPPGCDRC